MMQTKGFWSKRKRKLRGEKKKEKEKGLCLTIQREGKKINL